MAEAVLSYREKHGYLPAVLILLVETVGEDAMMKIVANLGGTRITMGGRSRSKNKLSDFIGKKGQDLIFARAERDGLMRIDIPRMDHSLQLRRHERILRLRAAGTMIADIALMLGMTERNVYYVLAADRATPDPRQLVMPF